MRTTVDLPDDLHQFVRDVANDTRMSLSEVIAQLIRQALGRSGTATLDTSELTGITTLSLGRTITSKDVRALDDEE